MGFCIVFIGRKAVVIETYKEVVDVVLRHAIVALDEVVVQEQSSVDEVLLCASQDNVSADVYALLGLEVAHDGEFAVRFVCWEDQVRWTVLKVATILFLLHEFWVKRRLPFICFLLLSFP